MHMLVHVHVSVCKHTRYAGPAQQPLAATGAGTPLGRDGAAKLRALDLSSSGVGDAGAAALARSCCTHTGSLSSLGLALNRIATKGAAAFVDALDQPDRNRALRSLTLSSNRISLRDLCLIESLVDRNRLATNRPVDVVGIPS